MARDFPASLFGIRSDGITLNTRSIQFAIDYISNKGGGNLVFSVGRYLTGSVHLKSGVGLVLSEGAVMVGSTNPLDYDKELFTALILATNQQKISISGNGIIDGRGREVAQNLLALIHAGIVEDPLRNDRPSESIRPMLIDFRSCRQVRLRNVTLRNAASWVETYDQCSDVSLDSITVDSKAYWNNDGLDIVDCDSVHVSHCFIDAADDGICLKSHDPAKQCNQVWIEHNVIRSSASAIKLGTASLGGFSHIRIIDNKVFNTYRSAIALEAVDGGFIDDVLVDSLQAAKIGNAIFLRIGERIPGKEARLHNVRIKNVSVDIPAEKPDSGYDYEGPVEDQPRNISPAVVITGLPGSLIDDVTFENVNIKSPGGGNVFRANLPLGEVEKVPDRPEAYPEFSMFGELPAWGIYIRHARNIQMTNVTLSAQVKDYRPSIVLDDAHHASFRNLSIRPNDRPKKWWAKNSTDIK
ncbi:MAG TPA: glycosyl hydrolase family 28 protein [Puia sp.]|nr:glycosyl hydrolase family 28 protein [Puia sp.]